MGRKHKIKKSKKKSSQSNNTAQTKNPTPLPSVLATPPESINRRTINNIFINHHLKNKTTSSESLPPSVINKQLKDFYVNKLMIRRLFYPDIPIPIEKCYINLSIVSGIEYHTQLEKFASISNSSKDGEEIYEYNNNIYGQPSIIMPAECIIPPNMQVNVAFSESLNTSVQVWRPKIKMLILGAAGIGKSTLSEYYTHLWANPSIPLPKKGGLTNYEWVFRIPLRNLTEERYPSSQPCTPMDVIERECLARVFGKECVFLNAADKIALETTLHQAANEKKVFIILDGFDEFPEKLSRAFV